MVLLGLGLFGCGDDSDDSGSNTVPIPGFRVDCQSSDASNCDNGLTVYSFGFILPQGTSCFDFDEDGETIPSFEVYNITHEGNCSGSPCRMTNFGSGDSIVWRNDSGAVTDRVVPGDYTVAMIQSNNDTSLDDSDFVIDSTVNTVICCQEDFEVKNESDMPFLDSSVCQNIN
jgi:hypothetical protein